MLEELREVLAGILPATSAAGYRVASESALRLGDGGALLPYWLALRSARFRWRCRLAREAGRTRFLFFTIGRISARERLDAEIIMEVRPVTNAEADDLGGAVPLPQTLALPASYGIRQDAKLEFRLGEQSFLVSLDDPRVKLSDDDVPKHIQLESWPRGEWEGPGDDVPWPLDVFVTFAFGLARASEANATQSVPLATFSAAESTRSKTTLLAFLMELAGTLQTAPGLVVTGDPRETIRNHLPLALNWRLVAGVARLGVLIDQSGLLVGPDEADTFLVPCSLELVSNAGKWSMVPGMNWPDFLLRGAVRDAALAAIEAEADWDEAAEVDALASLGCTRELLMSWADNEARSVLLRADRRKNNDEVLLLVAGQLRGVEVAVILHADKVTYEFEESGDLSAKAKNVKLIQAAPRAQALMDWETEEGGGKQAFCDVLHGFLRWHALVRPELAL